MNRPRHITVLVSNDLEHDQRVAKVCTTLLKMGFLITLVGRKLPTSRDFTRPYPVKRFRLLFRTGVLFYAALNIRFFFYLLFSKTDIILANDLDTLLPAFLVSRLRRKKLVYDSHEYFTEAEGLTGRNFQKKTWTRIEELIFPRLTRVYTVNESIASIYRNKYKADVRVVRNVPMLSVDKPAQTRKELELPLDRRIIILQGAYIDPDRGGLELVQAMKFMPDVLLLIIGSGRDIENLKNLSKSLSLQDRIRFYPRKPFEELRQYTRNCDLGISLDKPLHLNYTYSLPNKLFDYIHSETPVLVSDLPELRRIVETYQVGIILNDPTPERIASAVKEALESPHYEAWKTNCIIARNELNWQNEEKVLHEIYSDLLD